MFNLNLEISQQKDSSFLDLIDVRILSLLHENGRESLRTISDKLEISQNTINYRLKRLEKQGILKNYTINISFEELGYCPIIFMLEPKTTDKRPVKLPDSILYAQLINTADNQYFILTFLKEIPKLSHCLEYFSKQGFNVRFSLVQKSSIYFNLEKNKKGVD